MIEIAKRLFPFSHLPGTTCLIPATPFLVRAFPSCIYLYDLHRGGEKPIKEMKLEIEGPLKQFTICQNLERGCVTVWSEQYRFHILPSLEIVFRKNSGISSPVIRERLCLGNHKKQEWEAIRKRRDFREIFPLWFRLGSLVGDSFEEGESYLLDRCGQAISSGQSETILPAFEKLFLTCFGQMLVPRLKDEDHQGISPDPQGEGSPLYILKKGAALIRSLFVTSSNNEVHLLPHLPPELFSGRMMHIQCPPFGELDLEWSKKTVRRVHFRAKSEGRVTFHFPPSLQHFRLRLTRQDRGLVRICSEPLELKSGCHYLLDRFQN